MSPTQDKCLSRSQFILLLVGEIPDVDTFNLDTHGRREMGDFGSSAEKRFLLGVGPECPIFNLKLDMWIVVDLWVRRLPYERRPGSSVITHETLVILVLFCCESLWRYFRGDRQHNIPFGGRWFNSNRRHIDCSGGNRSWNCSIYIHMGVASRQLPVGDQRVFT